MQVLPSCVLHNIFTLQYKAVHEASIFLLYTVMPTLKLTIALWNTPTPLSTGLADSTV